MQAHAVRVFAISLLISGFAVGCDEGAAGPIRPDAGVDDGVPPPDGAVAGIPQGEVFETLGRLAVADLDEAQVAVWDLDVRAEAISYELTAPAELYSSSNRQITAVIAAQPTADRWDIFATGVWIWDHVDHFHVYKDSNVIQIDPDLAYEGGLTGVQVNSGWVVAYDAAGQATALFERSIGPLRSDVPRSRLPIFRSVEGEAHAGAALVARGQLFMTRADGGVDRYEQEVDGFESPERLECASPGAGAGAGTVAFFDCGEDYLLSRWDDENEVFEDLRIAVPEGAGRPTSLLGEDDLASFVGTAEGGLVMVDRTAATARFVAIDGEITEVTADRDGEMLVVLLASGELLDLDPVTGDERRRMDVGASSALHDIAVGEGFAYLTEPDAGLVHVVDLGRAFSALAPLEVGGRPGSLVVTALWPGGEPVMHE